MREEEGGLRATLQEVLALRARIAALGGDLPLALELVHQVGDPLPSDNPLLRSLVTFDLNAAKTPPGRTICATEEPHLCQSAEVGHPPGNECQGKIRRNSIFDLLG